MKVKTCKLDLQEEKRVACDVRTVEPLDEADAAPEPASGEGDGEDEDSPEE